MVSSTFASAKADERAQASDAKSAAKATVIFIGGDELGFENARPLSGRR